jgi:hypothetical protein
MLTTKAALALLASLLLASFAFAKTYTEPKSEVTIDLPDGWKTEEPQLGPNKLMVATADDGVSIVVMHIARKLPAVVMKRLADEMDPVLRDAKANDDADKVTLHGLQADKFTGNAQRDDKPVRFTMILLNTGSVDTVAIFAVGPETQFKRRLREIDAALDSIRPKQ